MPEFFGGGGGGGTGGVVSQSLVFGATWDSAGNFAITNGTAENGDTPASGASTRYPVAFAGTINSMAIFSSGDLSTNNATFKVHVNGVVQKTVTGSSAANAVDTFADMAISVAAGDKIEIEFDAGSTNPGQAIVSIIVEAS